MRFPSSPDNVLSLTVVWELCLDLAAPIWECFGVRYIILLGMSLINKCVCLVFIEPDRELAST
jgi:hypothetical protein